MPLIRRISFAALEALAGAYVGVLLLFVVLASTSPGDIHRSDLSWDGVGALIRFSVGGVVLLSWWIAPVGIAFDFILKPRMRGWPKSNALLKGSLTGAGLGLATAIVFFVLASDIPPASLAAALIVVPIYCAAWCGLYARKVAAGAHDRQG